MAATNVPTTETFLAEGNQPIPESFESYLGYYWFVFMKQESMNNFLVCFRLILIGGEVKMTQKMNRNKPIHYQTRKMSVLRKMTIPLQECQVRKCLKINILMPFGTLKNKSTALWQRVLEKRTSFAIIFLCSADSFSFLLYLISGNKNKI